MKSAKFIAYYRVSTARQGQSGLGLEAQQAAVKAFLSSDTELLEEFVEVESGKRADRPELNAALAACKRQRATLVIAKFDRLARNVAFVSNLMESGVEFVAADNPHASKLTIHILCAVAEHEREMISERTKAALAAAKARGVRLGSPEPQKGSAKGIEAIKQRADQFAANVTPVIDSIRASGVSDLRGIATALNARGIKSARGGVWYASTVRSVIQR
jgi:DNA invertase Pin-like site-specific DNA recombinase